jgi:long-chain acyl-CoA synthetase
MITCQPLDGERIAGSVGLPVEGVGFRIVTPDGQDVPQGEIGEIVFNGRGAMMGYYKNPEATAATVRDGWVHTGDLAYQDENRNVYIVDRIKDMIIRGGYNVYPREVEEVLYAHPAIAEAAVLGQPDDVLGEEVTAFIVAKEDVTEEQLTAHCKQHLAEYKVPRIYHFIEALPKNATGKILKAPLRKQIHAENEITN